MPDQFDEQEYKRKLIEGGLNASDARLVAARTAAARQVSGEEKMQLIDSFFGTLADKRPSMPEEQHAGPVEESAAVLRSRRLRWPSRRA